MTWTGFRGPGFRLSHPVVARLAFATPSSSFTISGATLRSLGMKAFFVRAEQFLTHLAFISSSEHSQRAGRLSAPPLLRFTLYTPLPFNLLRVHSHPRPKTLASAKDCHVSGLVPPSWFHTTSTACSALEPRRYCTPVQKGFAAFPRSLPFLPVRAETRPL